MARAFWKGSISFGLVEIPVALRPAVRTHDLDLTLLDRKNFSPIGYKRYNKKTGRAVEWNETVRGYEYEPDEYVVLSDDELRRANVKATQTIEIIEFVDHEEIDPLYFDTPYYVEALKQGSKSYALLCATLEKTSKVGIARVVLRTRQHLAALLVRDSVLVLNLLRYAHELAKPESVAGKGARTSAVSEREVKMANALVEGMTSKWDPEKFKDEYHDDVLALVKKKVASGHVHTVLEPDEKEKKPRRSAEVVDLMPLLKQSLEQHGSRARSRRAPERKKPERRAARTVRRKRSA